MIKNQLQYGVSQTQARKFEAALAAAAVKERPSNTHPLMWKAYQDGLASQLSTLRREIAEYDALTSGAVDRIEVNSLEELPLGLIKARIARGLTHKQLADIVGVRPQMIQRWEKEDYETAGFNRLVQIADALQVEVCESISFRRGAKSNAEKLSSLGIDMEFLRRRFVPEAQNQAHEIISASSRFLQKIWGVVVHPDGALDVSGFTCAAAGTARFKLPKNADPSRVRAYAQYAYFVAERVTSVMRTEKKSVPRDWRQLRNLLAHDGAFSLRSSLEQVWDWGIPVIPFSDPIRFHGSCWRIHDRNVVVLKPSLRAESRWLFDLLHELHHVGDDDGSPSFAHTEIDATDPERRDSDEERAANDFAGNALLDGKAEELYFLALERSHRRIGMLKRAVVSVAEDRNADIGVLANYVAFRLKADSYTDWWGTATNLQPESDDAYSIAASVFRERFDLSALPSDDREIVELAIAEPAV